MADLDFYLQNCWIGRINPSVLEIYYVSESGYDAMKLFPIYQSSDF
ncbi:hypothetical protein B879_00217 [Cecembia lonarensis LW9]|uniref:Uncharacterized protein n=1 Tax=Cecembia lonarensis (strain CCUG 58316 / KCTC 22772 / LW9) TaxID=1225176 RepID=K1L941_CECL9|nr:hypothetical protein B879_00217 [Cecembia lonarensis LW9]